jgi:hypothetical protein
MKQVGLTNPKIQGKGSFKGPSAAKLSADNNDNGGDNVNVSIPEPENADNHCKADIQSSEKCDGSNV